MIDSTTHAQQKAEFIRRSTGCVRQRCLAMAADQYDALHCYGTGQVDVRSAGESHLEPCAGCHDCAAIAGVEVRQHPGQRTWHEYLGDGWFDARAYRTEIEAIEAAVARSKGLVEPGLDHDCPICGVEAGHECETLGRFTRPSHAGRAEALPEPQERKLCLRSHTHADGEPCIPSGSDV